MMFDYYFQRLLLEHLSESITFNHSTSGEYDLTFLLPIALCFSIPSSRCPICIYTRFLKIKVTLPY